MSIILYFCHLNLTYRSFKFELLFVLRCEHMWEEGRVGCQPHSRSMRNLWKYLMMTLMCVSKLLENISVHEIFPTVPSSGSSVRDSLSHSRETQECVGGKEPSGPAGVENYQLDSWMRTLSGSMQNDLACGKCVEKSFKYLYKTLFFKASYSEVKRFYVEP